MMRTSKRYGWMLWATMVGAGTVLAGCGYTDLEMAAKQRQIDALVAQVNAMKAGTSAASASRSRALAESLGVDRSGR